MTSGGYLIEGINMMTDQEKIEYLLQEREKLCEKIADFYQVIGTMAVYLGYYDNGEVQPSPLTVDDMNFAMDYAGQPEVIYEEFLPWPKNTDKETEDHRSMLEKAAIECYNNLPEFVTFFD
jgi:hypothetical protein